MVWPLLTVAVVFPTHVGVFLLGTLCCWQTFCLPHARGGVSEHHPVLRWRHLSSPRTWGCFRLRAQVVRCAGVFPTHVGVFLPARAQAQRHTSLPHARGGVSAAGTSAHHQHSSSPRTWGCFPWCAKPCTATAVFPTHVGVFLAGMKRPLRCSGLPHARGGVSDTIQRPGSPSMSSPRTWGCFCPSCPAQAAAAVFPTHVGVFPGFLLARSGGPGLPHARGGVSQALQRALLLLLSSPRTWGCFCAAEDTSWRRLVFPTHVGVFPTSRGSVWCSFCLPHARGGVSLRDAGKLLDRASSPRTWGCFQHDSPQRFGQEVFPTHVGVFLLSTSRCATFASLPHARGGVSVAPARWHDDARSSPRTWGCFRVGMALAGLEVVFPTHVGVFLVAWLALCLACRLPHARGGVSF